MTLVTAAANPAFVVQVSDRRLTSAAGVSVEQETKAIHLRLPTSDMLIGYTGLARVGTKPMSFEISEALADAAIAAEFQPYETVQQFTTQMTERFRRSPIRRYRASDKRLTVMATGFVRFEEGHTVVQALVTNFQNWGVGDDAEAWDTFQLTPFSAKAGEPWPTLIQRVGAWGALSGPVAESQIRPLLAVGKPPHAVRDKMLALLPSQSALFSTVGVDANAAILLPSGETSWTHSVEHNAWSVSGGTTVSAFPESTIIAADVTITASDDAGNIDTSGTPMLVPRVPKQRPCPCGSGKRYRQCHGLNSGT